MVRARGFGLDFRLDLREIYQKFDRNLGEIWPTFGRQLAEENK